MKQAIAIAQSGFDKWAAKPHNKKWARKIDGTPIPNDLVVCIAEAFADAAPEPPARREALEAAAKAQQEDLERRLNAIAEALVGPNKCPDCGTSGPSYECPEENQCWWSRKLHSSGSDTCVDVHEAKRLVLEWQEGVRGATE